jgi:antirestriction protein ArdC
MMYRQAAGRGWQVRRGEQGTQIEFWEVKARTDKRSEPIPVGDSDGHQPLDEREETRGSRLIHRVHTVFNAKQIEGSPERIPNDRSMFEVVEAAADFENSGGFHCENPVQNMRATFVSAKLLIFGPSGRYGLGRGASKIEFS